jgi:flagellar biosynthesis protein FlhB
MILVAWPYDSNSLNYISLYNEVAVSVYLYILFQLTDYLDTMSETTNTDYSQIREILSWILTSILMLTIFINFIYTLYHLSFRFFANCRRVRERNREELRKFSEQKTREKYNQPF